MTAADTRGTHTGEFNKAAKVGRAKSRKKVAAPFSIRLSDDERELLVREAGKLSVAAHVRQKLFGSDPSPRRGRKPSRNIKKPSADQLALAKVLAALGRTDAYRSLATIAEAARHGVLPLTPELIEELSQACADIRTIRASLVAALGLKETGKS